MMQGLLTVQIQIPLQGLIIQEKREKVKGASRYLCTLTRNPAAWQGVIGISFGLKQQAGNRHGGFYVFSLFPDEFVSVPAPACLYRCYSASGTPGATLWISNQKVEPFPTVLSTPKA